MYQYKSKVYRILSPTSRTKYCARSNRILLLDVDLLCLLKLIQNNGLQMVLSSSAKLLL